MTTNGTVINFEEYAALRDEDDQVFDSGSPAPDRSSLHVKANPQPTIRARFLAFDAANPFVYTLLCRFARMVKSKGIQHYSMQALMEQVRWHVTFEKSAYVPSGAFKLNNDFCAHYSRLVMANEPDLDGMFALRILKAA